MIRTHLKLFGPVAVVLGLFANSGAEAAWVDVGPASSFDIGNITVSYDPSPALAVKYYDGNLTPQDPADVAGYTEDAFGLAAGSLTYVAGCDSPTGGCTNATGSTTTGTFQNIFSSTNGFNYLSMHFGTAQLAFVWSSAITDFQIGLAQNGTGEPTFGGLSNFRAYSGALPPSEVPIPAAVWLFGSALLGMVGISRRGALASKA
jgi:hypothetical protein